MLGYHTSSLWQQVYTADGSNGLAVIVDDDSGKPRMLGRFGDGPAGAPSSSGGIYSLAYPGELLHPNTSTAPAAASVIAHPGGWRSGARYYRDWLKTIGVGQVPLKSWFLEHTHSKGAPCRCSLLSSRPVFSTSLCIVPPPLHSA